MHTQGEVLCWVRPFMLVLTTALCSVPAHAGAGSADSTCAHAATHGVDVGSSAGAVGLSQRGQLAVQVRF